MSTEQTLGTLGLEAMDRFDAMIASGMPRADALLALEGVLRDIWPKPKDRSEPWKFYCVECSDTGWRPDVCTPATPCGRPFRLPGANDNDGTGRGRCTPGHAYAAACWCTKGQTRRAQLERRPPPDEDFTSAGKSKPMTRFGR